MILFYFIFLKLDIDVYLFSCYNKNAKLSIKSYIKAYTRTKISWVYKIQQQRRFTNKIKKKNCGKSMEIGNLRMNNFYSLI